MSAVSASSTALGSVPVDPVRALQHALYRAAKADPGRRFHALMDKVIRSDVLWRAWVMVRRNDGAPGIDKITLAAAEEYGVSRLLGEVACELRCSLAARLRAVDASLSFPAKRAASPIISDARPWPRGASSNGALE